MVRYGLKEADRRAFTKNLTELGIGLKTNNVMRPGTTLRIEVRAAEERFDLWGRVIWAKKVPPQLAHVLDCGMGIRLVHPGEAWVDFARQWQATCG
jgi:hypothetical protein